MNTLSTQYLKMSLFQTVISFIDLVCSDFTQMVILLLLILTHKYRVTCFQRGDKIIEPSASRKDLSIHSFLHYFDIRSKNASRVMTDYFNT